MNQLLTQGIILSRTDYGEADRIITLLTPDHGKLRLMAKGVRRVKSKLAGGIELFSISHIAFIQGRGEVGTLVSTRLITHYGDIVKDITRVQAGYDLIKVMNKATEDEPEKEYFVLLNDAFSVLNDASIDLVLIKTWFSAQLLGLSGHQPNLQSDAAGSALNPRATYDFNFDAMAFIEARDGHFAADHIKFIRLLFSPNQPTILQKIQDSDVLLRDLQPLVQTMLSAHIRL
ncbi:MAG TPA: DNA repair protein RecO [Candidatus Saccharimonadales bacterium]|nr:DNA repair protein RecO [Candidatus Saccharimonadales bacterium]